MKNIVFIVTFAFLMTSCRKNSSVTTTPDKLSDANIILSFSQMGSIHNKGMDKVFSDLQIKYGSQYKEPFTKENHDKLYQFVDSSVVAFVTKELSVKGIDFTEIIKNTNTGNNPRTYLELDLVSQMKSLNQPLSEEFLQAMNKLNALMDKNAPKDEYDDFVKATISTITDQDEKIKLVSAASIGFSSLNYWAQNTSKWYVFFHGDKNTNTPSRIENSASDIGRADVTGIITGGVGGCLYGAAGGSVVLPVVGTVAGCAGVGAVGAITGGIGNSLKTSIEKFVDWLF